MNLNTDKTDKPTDFASLDDAAHFAPNARFDVERDRTADGEIYDPQKVYFYFDSVDRRVKSSAGLRRIGEHLCASGVNVVALSRLHARRRDALTSGQRFLKNEIRKTEALIEKFEGEKSERRGK